MHLSLWIHVSIQETCYCRPAWEGGEYVGSESARLDALRLAINLGADFVDVEFKVCITVTSIIITILAATLHITASSFLCFHLYIDCSKLLGKLAR